MLETLVSQCRCGQRIILEARNGVGSGYCQTCRKSLTAIQDESEDADRRFPTDESEMAERELLAAEV
jgi:hypothetical protein